MAKRFLAICLLLWTGCCYAVQDLAALELLAHQTVDAEWQGKAVRILYGNLDRHLQLADCAAPKANWTNDRRLGSTGITLSCTGPVWSVRLPVQVWIQTNVVVTKRILSAGTLLQPDDVELRPARQNTVPNDAVLAIEDVAGKVLTHALAEDIELRTSMLKQPTIIKQNQTVRVLAEGGDFQAVGEGVAQNDASVGQVVSVRMPGGRTVQGIATADGVVQVKL